MGQVFFFFFFHVILCFLISILQMGSFFCFRTATLKLKSLAKNFYKLLNLLSPLLIKFHFLTMFF